MTTERFEPVPADLAVALAAARDAVGDAALNLYYISQVGSTNDALAGLAVHGAPEGTIVVADQQTAGRGRRGRSWHSPQGAGLYFSMLFRPSTGAAGEGRSGADETTLVTLMAGLATGEAIEAATGVRAALKWPNDLVIEQEAAPPRRLKLAGILAEGAALGTTLQYVVLGIGINLRVSAYPPDIRDRATSIEEETGRPPDRGRLVEHLVIALVRGRHDLSAGRGHLVVQRWRERAAASIGREVAWDAPAGRLRGRTRGIDDTGALLVDVEGHVHRIVSGEVTWL